MMEAVVWVPKASGTMQSATAAAELLDVGVYPVEASPSHVLIQEQLIIDATGEEAASGMLNEYHRSPPQIKSAPLVLPIPALPHCRSPLGLVAPTFGARLE